MTSENYKIYSTSSSSATTIQVRADKINTLVVGKSEVSEKNYMKDYVALFSQGKLIGTSDTVSFVNKLEEHLSKIAKVSDEVITALRRNLDYNGYYISFLLDQLSDEEFAKMSEEYAVNLTSEESEELIDKIKILFYISSQSYTPSELSNIFKIDEGIAERVVNRLREMKLIDSKESY